MIIKLKMNGKLLAIKFVSSKDFKETRIMYTNSDNIDIIDIIEMK